MPDWEKGIRKNLAGLHLPSQTREEVIAELASHIEECEEQNLSGDASLLHDFRQQDWRGLTRSINRAKCEEVRMSRARALYFPMFVNLLLTSAILNIGDKLGMVDLSIRRSGHMPWLQPWLVTLPLCGAIAALLARRAKGSSTFQLLAALGPCIVWLAALVTVELIFVSLPGTFSGVSLRSLGLAAIGWCFFPALALFAGAAPFLTAATNKVECE